MWHGERNEEADTKKKPTRRLFYMLWMLLLKVVPNSLYILLTLMFLFCLSGRIQICARAVALLLGLAVVVEPST